MNATGAALRPIIRHASWPVLGAIFACRSGEYDRAHGGTVSDLAARILAADPVASMSAPAGFNLADAPLLEPGDLVHPRSFWLESPLGGYGRPPIRLGVFGEPEGAAMRVVFVMGAEGACAIAPLAAFFDHGAGLLPGSADRLRAAHGLQITAALSDTHLRMMDALVRTEGSYSFAALPDGNACVARHSWLPRIESTEALRRALSSCVIEQHGKSRSDRAAPEVRELAGMLFEDFAREGPQLVSRALKLAATHMRPLPSDADVPAVPAALAVSDAPDRS